MFKALITALTIDRADMAAWRSIWFRGPDTESWVAGLVAAFPGAVVVHTGNTPAELMILDASNNDGSFDHGLPDDLDGVHYVFVRLAQLAVAVNQTAFPALQDLLEGRGFERISALDAEGRADHVIWRNRQHFKVAHPHVVLSQPWGGLGDNLAMSTLPEMYARQGVTTYLAADNASRNDEIRRLVWAHNPFVRGTLNAPQTAGSETNERHLAGITMSKPFIERIECAHGLPGRNDRPEVFRKPLHQGEFASKVVIDLGSVSVTGGSEKLTRYVQFVLGAFQYKMEDLLQVRFRNYSAQHGVHFSNIPLLELDSLEHYHDLLYSVRAFITVHSGAQSLAAATQRQSGCNLSKIHCYATPFQFNTRIYIYEGVEYYVE